MTEVDTVVRRAVVVAGPDLVVDRELFQQVAEAEFRRLGLSGSVWFSVDAAALRAAVTDAVQDAEAAVVVVPGSDPATRAQAAPTGPRRVDLVWYDLEDGQRVTPLTGGVHLAGRGLFGLTWAIRHAYWRLRAPAERLSYGDHADQWADLRMPGTSPGSSPPAVVVLLHGGFWRSEWGADLMDALAVDLSRRGYASWNVEYRRPDRHGWAATVADVADSVRALESLAPRVDPDRVAVIGHSAGGQLALQVAGRGRVHQVVSLAGVLDLREGDRRTIGYGAVPAALGGHADELPEVYRWADPMAALPVGVPQVVVQGDGDDLDLRDFNRRYVVAAWDAGEEVTYLEQEGDHFSVIDPASDIWQATAQALLPP